MFTIFNFKETVIEIEEEDKNGKKTKHRATFNKENYNPKTGQWIIKEEDFKEVE